MHSTPALTQFEHGCLLSHRTFLFLQVLQDLAFSCGDEALFDSEEVLFWKVVVVGGDGPLPLTWEKYVSDAANAPSPGIPGKPFVGCDIV